MENHQNNVKTRLLLDYYDLRRQYLFITGVQNTLILASLLTQKA
jgi:hypothetical protein